MATVTVTKKEYEELLDAKLRYAFLRDLFEKDIFSPPPTRKINEIVTQFRATRNYSAQFLKSFERGLKRSSYFKS